jgi:hypothetical protein
LIDASPRRSMEAMLLFALLVAGAAANDDTIAINSILNSGFEMVADSTTSPPKYGAYWENAFAPRECDPWSCIELEPDGNRVARLDPTARPIQQILTLFGPHSDAFTVELRWRPEHAESRLVVLFQSEGGAELTFLAGPALEGATALAVAEGERDAAGFMRLRLEIGATFRELAGAAPPAWATLSFRALGGAVALDDVTAAHHLPRVTHSDLKEALLADVRDALAVWLEDASGRSGKGLALIDRDSGYATATGFDVESGAVLGRTHVVAIGGIHEVLLRYARIPNLSPDDATLLGARDVLRTFAYSALKNNVYAPTGLYCLYDRAAKRPITTAELSPTHFIQTILDIAELFPDDAVLANYAKFHAEKMADVMVKLRAEHDLPRNIPFGRGAGGNWFGRMPEKVSPLGVLAPPKKATYDQSWAIAFDRSWYHDFDTAVGLMRVHRVKPKPDYLEAVRIACAKFDRVFDATRYDMENDTDDHYGRNVESALEAFRYSNGDAPELLAFAQHATDHRLDRTRPLGESVWVQGIRLGSFTTGDQPRGFRGPVGLYRLPRDQNALTSGFEPYVDALREITHADLRRRLLDDGFLTEASSFQWRMISACFRGNFIAPCDSGTNWEGNMGDLFAGPPTNAFRALLRVLEIDHPGQDREWVAWHAALHAHVLERYRARYGYRFGLSIETGRRYGLRESDLQGWSTTHPYGLAVTLLHTELLESGVLERAPAGVRIRQVTAAENGEGVRITIEGPPGRRVAVFAADAVRSESVSENDARLRRVSRRLPHHVENATFGADGAAELLLPVPGARVAIDVELPFLDGSPRLEDLAGGEFAISR